MRSESMSSRQPSVAAVATIVAMAIAGFYAAIQRVAISSAVAAQDVFAQESRFTNSQYNVSFQPPPGWNADILVRYLGPQRPDGTTPTLNLIVHGSTTSLNEQEIARLTSELVSGLTEQGAGNVQVVDRRVIKVAGIDSLQIDITYTSDVPMRLRQVYIPVNDQNRTFLFTFVDTNEHFAETVAAAERAIASFNVPRQSATAQGQSSSQAGSYTLLLVVVGMLALAVAIGGTYVLLKRPSAH
jgi:hypothetical protein